MKKPKISIVGLGFVGLTLAVVNAKNGFYTIGIDNNITKLEKISSNKPDFYEPKLERYLKETVRTNRIFFSYKLKDILKTDITFLCVGTPSTSQGKIDLSQLKKVALSLAKLLKNKKTKHLLVIKSTVIPTTTSKTILPIFKKMKNVRIIVNPEFLREGNAVKDLENPHLIVIGETDKKDGNDLEKYYNLFYKKLPEIIRTDLNTAEMIKYSNNAFLATKISFINSIANICQQIPNVDVNKIAYAIGKDSRIGPQFLKAGPGFGGSCLPKDLSALIEFTNKFGKINNLLKAVRDVNELQPNQIIGLLEQMNLYRASMTVAILGLAFKKNTDDIREAVSLKLVKNLLKKGVKVRVHDPMALDNFKKKIGDKITYCQTIENCLTNSNCCIILTEWDDYKKINREVFSKNMKEVNIIDARRILNPSDFSKFNFKAIGLGNDRV